MGSHLSGSHSADRTVVEVRPALIVLDRRCPQRLPVTESVLAQVPADSPAHALNGCVAPPGAKTAADVTAEDYIIVVYKLEGA